MEIVKVEMSLFVGGGDASWLDAFIIVMNKGNNKGNSNKSNSNDNDNDNNNNIYI
jgi:hypothetical protein